MKTKTLLLAALVGVVAASAQARVSWNISIGLPLPVFCPPPVVCAPPPVVYAAPCPPPAPPVFVQAVPVCPSPVYVWVNGGWACRPAGYATGYGFPVNHPVQFQHRVEHIERDQYLRGLRR